MGNVFSRKRKKKLLREQERSKKGGKRDETERDMKERQKRRGFENRKRLFVMSDFQALSSEA